MLGAVTPADVGGLLGCTVTGDGVGQVRGLAVEFLGSLVFVFVVCAGLIGTGGGDDCRASVASTEDSEFCSSRQVAPPFAAGVTITGLSVFAVRIDKSLHYFRFQFHFHRPTFPREHSGALTSRPPKVSYTQSLWVFLNY